MKKISLFLIVFVMTVFSSSVFAKEKVVKKYVAVNSAVLREKPSALSNKVCTLDYATEVHVKETKKGWLFVVSKKNENLKGWIPSSSLSDKKLVAKGNKTSVDANEIALAGKGFNAAIEKEYAATEHIDYSGVNYIERINVSETEVINFISSGKLNEGDDE